MYLLNYLSKSYLSKRDSKTKVQHFIFTPPILQTLTVQAGLTIYSECSVMGNC